MHHCRLRNIRSHAWGCDKAFVRRRCAKQEVRQTLFVPEHGQHVSKYKGAHSATAHNNLPAAQISTITTDSATANQAPCHNRP